jgi:hypothetical protein
MNPHMMRRMDEKEQGSPNHKPDAQNVVAAGTRDIRDVWGWSSSKTGTRSERAKHVGPKFMICTDSQHVTWALIRDIAEGITN